MNKGIKKVKGGVGRNKIDRKFTIRTGKGRSGIQTSYTGIMMRVK